MTTAWPLLLIDAARGPEQVGPSVPQGTGPLTVRVGPHVSAPGGRTARADGMSSEKLRRPCEFGFPNWGLE
jgi:hypothetical protein